MLKRMLLAVLLTVVLMGTAAPAWAQHEGMLITYGSDAQTREGDDDFRQVVFFSVPATYSGQFFLRVFDADIGGAVDQIYGEHNTTTRFRLFGGRGAFSHTGAQGPYPVEEQLVKGTIIHDETIGIDPFRDNKWYTFATLAAIQGDRVEDRAYFKLVVEGVSGDDGNAFNVAVSTDSRRNIAPEGLRIFTFHPTVHLPGPDVLAELPFRIPEDAAQLGVHGFDLAGADTRMETLYRGPIKLNSSGQGEWAKTDVAIEAEEQGTLAALTFSGGAEQPNDATFYITAATGETIPMELPFMLRQPNSRPQPALHMETLSDCRTVMFDASASKDANNDVLSYAWDFGDAQRADGVRVVHQFEKIGVYAATLYVKDDSGHVGSTSRKAFSVSVNAPPKADAGVDRLTEPGRVLTFVSNSSDSDGKLVRHVWDFGDGSTAEGQTVTHAFEKSGFYAVTLRVEDNSNSPCNSAVDKAEVWVNAPPVVEAGEDRIGAVGEKVTFTDLRIYDSDGDVTRSRWDFGDGASAEGDTVVHSYEKPGRYTVGVSIVDNSGMPNGEARDSFVIYINDMPIAAAGDDRWVAVGETVTFDGSKSKDPDGKIVTYTWDIGDGILKNGVKVTHAFDRPGAYPVTLTIQDDSQSISDKSSDTVVIHVNDPPVAEAGDDQTVTSSVVQFSGGATRDSDGEIIAWHWDFGDGMQSTEASPLHVYRNPGTYAVTLTVTDSSGTSTRTDTDSMTVIVNRLPVADAGSDRTVEPGQEVPFDASQSTDTDGRLSAFIWDFGDGTTAEGMKVTHTYKKPGYYSVSLTVRDDSGHESAFDYDEVKVFVNHSPVANPGPELRTGPGEDVVLDGTGSYDLDGKIDAYSWEFTDGTTAEGARVTKRFAEPGLYTALLTVKDNSGANNARSTAKTHVQVNYPPVPKPGPDLSTCNSTVEFDGSASLDADGDALVYQWDFGDGSEPRYGMKAVHTYLESGNFPVTLSVDDGNGFKNSKQSASISLSINHPPVADAGGNRTICAGDIVLFDGSGSRDPEGSLLKYYWDFGDGEKSEKLNPTKSYEEGGAFQISLLVKDDSGLQCNTGVDQAVAWVAESPVAVVGDDLTACVNTQVNFDGSKSSDFDGEVNSFLWDFGDGTTGGSHSPTHVYTKAGSYHVVLTIRGDQIGQCNNTDTDEQTVTILDAPVALINAPALIKEGQTITLDASSSDFKGSNVVSYAWDFGDGTTGEGQRVKHTYKKYGKYFATLTLTTDADERCNVVSARQMIRVNAAPVAEAGADLFVGLNDVINFDASKSNDPDGSITSYAWDFGDGTTGTGVFIRHKYEQSGEYKVTLSIRDNTELENNSASDSLMVKVNTSPVAMLSGPSLVCPAQEAAFVSDGSYDADGAIAAYGWSFGDGATATGASVAHAFANPGLYTVTLSVDDGTDTTNNTGAAARTISVNRPPTAGIAAHKALVCPGEPVAFSSALSTDRDGKISAAQWNFGDGSTAEGMEVTHAYAAPGRYRIDLGVRDDSGLEACSTAETSSAIEVNAPPVAHAGGDREAYVGGALDYVHFNALESRDPDGASLLYFWDFGDGGTASSARVSHAYTKAGEYTVRLRVMDGSGTKCSDATDELKVLVKQRKDNATLTKK